jgi:hypothetical protein
MLRFPTVSLCLVLTAGLYGCGGPPKHSLKGTVTRGGERLTWPEGGQLLVVFFPEDRKKHPEVYSATTDIATSSYSIAAIPAGRYKVAVQQFDTKFMDALGGVYDPSKTKLVFEVIAQDGQTLNIDLPVDSPASKRRGMSNED